MPQLRELMEKFLKDGRIDGREVESLSGLLYADGRIDHAEAEFLVELRRRVERASPAFDRFYFAALKKFVLAEGGVSPVEAAWLRRVLADRGRPSDAEQKLLRELRGEATRTCPEFDELVLACTS